MANQFPNVTRSISRFAVLGFIALILVIIFSSMMSTTVRSGQSAVRYSIFGGTDLSKTYGEGIKIYPPWVDLIRYDVRIGEKLEQLEALSSNGLTIKMDVSVLWRPQVENLPLLHTTFGEGYYTKLIQPELRSAVREVVGRFTPEELYSSKRTELQEDIFERVVSKVGPQFVDVTAVLIRDVSLPNEIKTAIENKLKEEQEAERYEFTLRKEELEAQRKKIEADGEAEYQRIITGSLSSAFLRFKGIEATQQLANSSNTKTIIVGSGQDGLPLILGGQ